MAASTQPVLDGNTLAHPFEAEMTIEYRGGSQQMADGSIVHQLVDSNGRAVFNMRWRSLSASELSTIETGYDAVKDGTATLTFVDGNNYTVTRPENGNLRVSYYNSAGELLHRAELTLVEDS